jgi:hypothetical protein
MFSHLAVSVAMDAPEPSQIYGQDSIVIELTFVNPKVEFARGYFGQHTYELDEHVAFADDINMPTGALNLDAVTLEFSIENNVGVDAQIHFDELHGINGSSDVLLDNADIYQVINIARAEEVNGFVVPDVENLLLDNSNSNVDAFIENLPNELLLKGEVLVNPLGDISAGNDFIYTANALNTFINLDIPLCVGMNGLTLTDTLSISSEADFTANGKLIADFTNAFPFSAKVSLVLLDQENDVITSFLSNQEMEGANLISDNETIPVESTWTIYLTQDEITEITSANKLLLTVVFDTPALDQHVKLFKDYFIDFRLRADATTEVSLE